MGNICEQAQNWLAEQQEIHLAQDREIRLAREWQIRSAREQEIRLVEDREIHLAEDRQMRLAEERKNRLAEERQTRLAEEQKNRLRQDWETRRCELEWTQLDGEQNLRLLHERLRQADEIRTREANLRAEEIHKNLIRVNPKWSSQASNVQNFKTPTPTVSSGIDQIVTSFDRHHLTDNSCVKFDQSKTPSRIYQTILRTDQAAEFNRAGKISQNNRLLSPYTSEYKMIERKFCKSCWSCVCIEQIYSLENPFLLGQYLLKKATLEARYGRNNVQERLLFHGTKSCNIDNICNNNLDWRLFGTSIGNRFGQGISFARNAKYAAFYCDKNKNDVKVMLVFCVAVGPTCEGSAETILPPKWDAASPYSNTKKPNGDVIVAYSDNEFYPAYKIVFTGDVKKLRAQKY